MIRSLSPRHIPLKQCLRTYATHRSQNHGPHKEYFQDPTSYPQPEAMPSYPQPLAPISYPQPQVAMATPAIHRRPPYSRLLRSMVWAGLFCTLGVVTVQTMEAKRRLDKTERGSHNDQMYMEVIKQRFQRDPLVQLLSKDPEWQDKFVSSRSDTDPYPLVAHIDPYSATAMGGSQGIQSMSYFNRSKMMVCFIVHIGEGVEGEPYLAHEGALASLMEDSLDWLSSLYKCTKFDFLRNVNLLTLPHSRRFKRRY